MFSLGRSEKTGGQAAAQAGTTPAPAANPQALAEASKNLETIQYSFREVAKMVLPVVVEVDVTEQIKGSAQAQNPFDWFFNQTPGNNKGGPRPMRQGLGSGIIVKRTGDTYYVLTNNHVVDGATDISVKLYDQQTFKAKYVDDLKKFEFSEGGDKLYLRFNKTVDKSDIGSELKAANVGFQSSRGGGDLAKSVAPGCPLHLMGGPSQLLPVATLRMRFPGARHGLAGVFDVAVVFSSFFRRSMALSFLPQAS
jgi:hypothetical protein